MDVIEKFGETVANGAKTVVGKAKDLTDSTKLSMEIKSKEDYLQRMYAEIGKKYYELNKGEEFDENYPQMELIRDTLEEIRKLKGEKLEKKGTKTCSCCGKEIKINDAFCSGCGLKLRDI